MPGTPPTTARMSIPRISDGDPVQAATQLNGIADTVDAKAGMYSAGTRAARLAATNVDGLLWRETDTGQLFLGTGSTWVPLGFSYVSATVNTTATNGQWLVASAGVTITLPSATANARVVVSAASGVSGSSQVTVSGSNIQGVGLSSAASFKLGTPGAFAELISDGTNWFIVAGGQDTGWLALILSTGMSGYNVGTGSPVPGARLVGDRVYLRGSVTQGASGNSATSIATLPGASMYPTISVAWSGTFLAGPYTAGAYNVSSSGVLTVTTNAGNGGVFFFEGLNFSLSD